MTTTTQRRCDCCEGMIQPDREQYVSFPDGPAYACGPGCFMELSSHAAEAWAQIDEADAMDELDSED